MSQPNRIAGARNRRVVKSLLDLKDLQKVSVDFSSFVKYYLEHGNFTPAQCAMLVGLFKVHDITFRAEDMRITLRKDIHKEQLRALPFFKVQQIWACMTKQQQDYYNEEIAKYQIKN